MKDDRALIAAFTGGGGKTSLIFYLAEKLSGEGRRVIVTTTTHMAWEPERPFAQAGDIRTLCHQISKYGYAVVAHHEAGQPKISGICEEMLEELSGFCDLLLVEADGSRRMPLKIPALWEPAIPRKADIVVGVLGLDSIGGKICDTVHRPKDVAAFLGKSPEEPVTWEDVAKIAVSPKGLRKGTEGRRFLVYLNKVDVLQSLETAKWIKESCKCRGIDVVCGSLRKLTFDRAKKGAPGGKKKGRKYEYRTDHAGSGEQQAFREQ